MSRCDFTDLDTSSCAHCLGHRDDQRTLLDRDQLLAQPGWLLAQYRGLCTRCGEHYQAGVAIRRDSAGGWLAECCAEDLT